MGSIITRPAEGSTTKIQYSQRFENCWPEIVKNAVTGQAGLVLTKRPGFTPYGLAAPFVPCKSANVSWTGYSPAPVAVFGVIDPSAATGDLKIGYVDTTAGTPFVTIGAVIAAIVVNEPVRINETRISNQSYLTVVASLAAAGATQAWFLLQGAAGFTQIVSANYPPQQATPLRTVGNFAHMDGYAFIMDVNGKVWNSDLNSLVNWTATSFIDASSSPDGGAGVVRSKSYIIAFGTQSIDPLYNAGNATGSPLDRVKGASIGIGAAKATDGATILPVGDSIYFIGVQRESGQYGVYVITGAAHQKISRITEDKLITAAFRAGLSYAIAGAVTWHGAQHLIFIAPDNSVYVPNLAYCIDTGVWWVLAIEKTSGVYNGSIASVLGLNGSGYVFGTGATNFFYASNDETYVDIFTSVRLRVRTDEIDHGTRNRKFYKSIELVGEIRETTGNTTITYTDNDNLTWTTAGTVDMSAVPPLRPRLTRLGSGARRGWGVEDQVNAPFRASAIDIEFEVGKS